MSIENPCGWHGTVADFLALDQAALLASLAARHERVMGLPPSGEQLAAWRGEYETLGATLREIVATTPPAREWVLVFEYELPRERGRRPDVVILTGSQVLVLEFILKRYGGDSTRTPEEHIWVYDEAQRAWDSQRVLEKRGHDRSEPEDFLSIGSRKDSWALMVGLIGEGQEIYLGEEAGLTQWNDAIARTSDSWTVHCTRKIADIFESADRLDTNESLDLDTSLRTHLAEDVQGWVEDLLEGRLDAAAGHAEAMEKQGFRLYLTRELEQARGYVRERVAA